jgi:hypothetical protein
MRRAITEWGLVVSSVLTVALGLIWADSLWLGMLQEPLALAPDCFVRVNPGQICLFSKLGNDWKPTTSAVERPALSWVRHYSIWLLPGLEYHHRLLASGETIWSFELALIIPVVVLLTAMVIFWRIRTGHWWISRSPAK